MKSEFNFSKSEMGDRDCEARDRFKTEAQFRAMEDNMHRMKDESPNSRRRDMTETKKRDCTNDMCSDHRPCQRCSVIQIHGSPQKVGGAYHKRTISASASIPRRSQSHSKHQSRLSKIGSDYKFHPVASEVKLNHLNYSQKKDEAGLLGDGIS